MIRILRQKRGEEANGRMVVEREYLGDFWIWIWIRRRLIWRVSYRGRRKEGRKETVTTRGCLCCAMALHTWQDYWIQNYAIKRLTIGLIFSDRQFQAYLFI